MSLLEIHSLLFGAGNPITTNDSPGLRESQFPIHGPWRASFLLPVIWLTMDRDSRLRGTARRSEQQYRALVLTTALGVGDVFRRRRASAIICAEIPTVPARLSRSSVSDNRCGRSHFVDHTRAEKTPMRQPALARTETEPKSGEDLGGGPEMTAVPVTPARRALEIPRRRGSRSRRDNGRAAAATGQDRPTARLRDG